jgi:hypothetical protein
MSINLHCKEMELWQTPTYITKMCYSSEQGGWKGIRNRYIEWVKHHTDGVYDNEYDLEMMRERVKIHIEELCSHKKLTFYWM